MNENTVTCFGELLLRLSPPDRHLLAQAQSLELVVGGAEANVASALAALGHGVRFASVAADNPLGERALAAGVPVCFDGNYRAQLWAAWDSDPATILRELVADATILIGNHRDISLLLGRDFSGEGEDLRPQA